MSLDVYLRSPDEERTCEHCGGTGATRQPEEYFEANITHNLNEMADAAGIYKELWRPDEIGITAAGQLVEPLTIGLAALKADPEKFRKLNPSNGWGRYEDFVPWVEAYLAACEAHPDAIVEVSR